MAKRPKRLTEGYIAGQDTPGVYGDGRGGHGLQLRVRRTTAGHVTKRWRQQIRIAGKVTHVGLGWWPAVKLAEARVAAMANVVAVYNGEDPRSRVRAVSARPVAAPVAPVGPTFQEAAEKVIALNRAGWRTARTEEKWRSEVAACPFRVRPVGAVTSGDILTAIAPVWTEFPSRGKLRLQVVRAVLRWAVAAGLRTDDPTLAVRAGLPKQKGKVTHYRAVEPARVGEAVRKIRRAPTRQQTRLALEFLILTAARPGEVAGATWGEFDLAAGCWRIPGSRMKSGREHRVPLSRAAVSVLSRAAPGAPGALVFPSATGKPIGGSSWKDALRRAGVVGTAHGFRSTFRDWAGETGIDRTLAELCLAHRIGDATEQAYARSDLLARRRQVMERWGRHVDGL